MSYSLSAINEGIKANAAQFISESDNFFGKMIHEAADRIGENISRSPIVFLSGPSGSGKTTTAKKIEQELQKRGINTHTISLDNYFITVDPKTAPRTPHGEIDYESPLFLDMDLLNDHFTKLAHGEEIHVPHFKFSLKERSASKFTPVRLQENEIAIFEGIHALNDTITQNHQKAFKLYISARSNIIDNDAVCFKGTWMRLVRRVVRDNNFRGSSALLTLSMWDNVRRGEKLHISPYKDKADFQLDSSLPYEVSVMKKYAKLVFKIVPEGTARLDELQNIMSAFDLFADLDDQFVPPDSLLREFIGGGIYEY